jgi:transketolase
MTTAPANVELIKILEDKSTRLRIDSIRATTAAGSGHPTSCASAAEIVSTLFFSVMRYDPKQPHDAANDVFVLSKGHAAPILYAAWSEAGLFPREHLLTLREVSSDLEGHPTPRLPYVDVATGSLGQGLPAGIGIALAARMDKCDQRVYVLLGDGESAEGSVWEAAEIGSNYGIDNLCAVIDVNRLGQSGPTMLQHRMNVHKGRWEAFGWQAIVVGGHDVSALLEAFDEAKNTTGKPTVILAETLKGKGMDGYEDKEGWHGRPLPKDEAERVVAILEKSLTGADDHWTPNLPDKRDVRQAPAVIASLTKPPYVPGGKEVATRKAFGDALQTLAKVNPRVVALDGDVKNSTHADEFLAVAPDRFFEGYIAEQNMAGMSMGLAARGKIPFASTFACFLSRAFDFVRMAAISNLNVKFCGTHVGVSIGEDGPSQMGLEDIAMFAAEPGFTVLYPSDATSAWAATMLAAEHVGPTYIRLGRPNTPIIYGPEESFQIGKAKVVRAGNNDRVLVVAAGVTLLEALKAHDELKRSGIDIRVIDLFSIQPIDRETLLASTRVAGNKVITVEDHYVHGGLGDAVQSVLSPEGIAVYKIGITKIPHSGKPEELIEKFGISSKAILAKVRELLEQSKLAA